MCSHNDDDPRFGQPLCLYCYGHEHQAVWDYFSGELWRRTKQAVERHLAARHDALKRLGDSLGC
ncbi:hypothetical protein PSN13_04033 [Micromonospora saelicesensis]|uniref:Uncharacterized protein n=1 Tax=Micromonospora saelicesensis TaxID=285676 RepID=A0A328NIE6_9ACTN|nr:hypothetical protein PSN13_04033 [Micromonospora saelicesensis]